MESAVRQCPECGSEQREAARFCGRCGAALDEARCPSCGAANPRGYAFCDGCGQPLHPEREEERPAVDPAAPAPSAVSRASAAAVTPSRSRRIAGRYALERFLGEGARKRVYLGRDARLQRQVAVALVKLDGLDETGLVRTRREAEAMAQLGDSPHVVSVFDTGEENGELYIVSEYVAGGELAALLENAEGGQLPIEDVLRIGAEVARALEHVHARNVVHRDLKPQNIWLAPDGTAKLGDFGLAVASDRSRLTVEGAMVGTVSYMPPEQALGRGADARSDIYSLGAVLYELLCGVPPFVGDDAAAVISQHVSTPPMGPSWHRAEVPAPLQQLILKMLAKSPDERPQTASEVVQALDAIASASTDGEAMVDEQAEALERLAGGAFVGRDGEIGELRAAADAAVSGKGRIVMVAGELGMGKTRLAAEAATYAQLRGALVLWGRCVDDPGAPPYWPWVQAIRSYVSDRDPDSLSSELGPGASDIAQVVSEIRERLPELEEPVALQPEQARFRLFDAISNFLVNIARRQPLALILDNLHVADRPSLLLLEFLARSVPESRILLVGTYRHDELDRDHPLSHTLAALSRERSYSRLRLTGLTEDQVKTLLENVSQQRLESPDELAMVKAVHRESEGNPYFTEEIMRHLVESGRIYRSEDGAWVSDVRRVEDLGIPEGIRDAIGRRMATLSPECSELLRVASVIGRGFPLGVLARVSGVEEQEAAGRLQEAIEANVTRGVTGSVGTYEFVHAAMRDALRTEISEKERLGLHQRVGEVLEEHYGDEAESHLPELAHHFVEAAPAGDPEKAADYAWWAGERAVAQHAYEDAVRLFEQALRLLGSSSDEPTRRCELLLALGDARWKLGDTAAAKGTFLEAANLARELSLADAFARAALGYGGGVGGFGVSDRVDETLVELLRAALRRLPEQDSSLRVRLLGRLAAELYYADGAEEERHRLGEEGVQMAQRIGDPGIQLLALHSRQWSLLGPDEIDRQLKDADEILRLARAVEDQEMKFRGHHFRLNLLLQLGDVDGVDREIRACVSLAEQLRQPYYQWQAGVFRAMRAIFSGRMAEGERLATQAFQAARGHSEMAAVMFGAQAFFFSWGQERLAGLVEGGKELADRYPRSAWPAALAFLYAEVGREDEARAALAQHSRLGFENIRRDGNLLTALATLSMAAAGLEDKAAARALYDLMLPYADLFTAVLTGAGCMGSNHVFLGATARTIGRFDDAIEHFEKALAKHKRIGALFFGGRIHQECARALLSRGAPGDRERALELIEKGIEAAHKLEMSEQVEELIAMRLETLGIESVEVQTSIEAVAESVEADRPDLRPAAAPDGTVTVMFSDIEDSTILTERLGDRRWMDLLHRHNEIIRDATEQYGGYEVKAQGDGFMLAFASARAAIHCAIATQRAFAEERGRNADEPLRVRIGLHTGEVLREADDFFGKNVILAARIAGQARGNEILVSSLVRELVASTGEFEFGDEREVELKGLTGTHHVFDVPWSEAVPREPATA